MSSDREVAVDWSEPAAVVMSHGTAAVLRAVAGADEPFTIRQLARVANISLTRTRQAVNRLADHGLLIVDTRPGFNLVQLNRDHLAAESSIALATLRARMLERLRDEVAGWSPPALHVSLFGSAARGDGGTRSDLDLLVVRTSSELSIEQDTWDDQLARSGQAIHRWTGNWVGWFQASDDDLRRMDAAGEPILTEWRRDAITLFGPPLSRLLRNVW